MNGGAIDLRLGALSTAMANLAGRFGRNPGSATSWWLGQNCVVAALDGFLTTGEQERVEQGDARLVRQLRSTFVEAVGDDYLQAAERALGREVIAHRSEIISASSICLEIFLLGKVCGLPLPNGQHARA